MVAVCCSSLYAAFMIACVLHVVIYVLCVVCWLLNTACVVVEFAECCLLTAYGWWLFVV